MAPQKEAPLAVAGGASRDMLGGGSQFSSNAFSCVGQYTESSYSHSPSLAKQSAKRRALNSLNEMMNAATMRVRGPHLEAIRALGVAWRTIGYLGEYQAPFGVMNGTVVDTGLFEPGEGPAYVVQPVIVTGAIIDIVAWRTIHPERWHLMTGLGWCMGEDTLSLPAGNPVTLQATPLAWLASGGDGCCVLDWAAPELRILRGQAEFAVTEPALGDLLRRKLAQTMPRIINKGVRHAQAA